jgi:LacI family transcriptional regulator
MRDKKKPATILDVARYVGVSSSTVSRVLTGNAAVTTEKRDAIMAAIETLGYRPNTAARGLVNGATMMVGALSPDIGSPYYGEIIKGIEYGLRDTGYTLMIIPRSWQFREPLQAISVFHERRVDGAIVLAGNISDIILQQLAEDLPLVVIGQVVPGIEKNCVRVDNVEGAYAATRYLIDLGHTRIAHVSGPDGYQDSVERRLGYERALEDAGLSVDERLIVQGDFREESGILALEMLLTRGVAFSAIFVGNDQMAQGVQLALYRRGMRIPEEVSIVGYDDQPNSAFCRPPLTTVQQPTFEMGRAAADAILALLQQTEVSSPELSSQLIVRESAVRIDSLPGWVGARPQGEDRRILRK